MSKTLILRPLEGEDLLQAEQYKYVYADIQVFVEKLGPDPGDMTFEEFLAKVGVSETVYIFSIPSSLHKAKIFIMQCQGHTYRCIHATFILLHAWQANHDIQFILDIYSLIVYVCDYMTKAQKGMSLLLSEACKEAKAGNMT